MKLNLTDVTKNLLILNIVVFVLTFISGKMGMNISDLLALHYVGSPLFKPTQLISHMFVHGGLMHLAFNMIGLIIFGPLLEGRLGKQRFFIFYFLCGFGALALHQLYDYYIIQKILAIAPNPDGLLEYIRTEGAEVMREGKNFFNSVTGEMTTAGELNRAYNGPVVGASGAIYGLFAAFAVLFPNIELMIFPIFIPIKAKYLLVVMVIVSLVLGFANFSGDNVAHFAHLGGALVGFILIKNWKIRA